MTPPVGGPDTVVRHPDVTLHQADFTISEDGLPWWLGTRGWSEAVSKVDGTGVRIGILDTGFDRGWSLNGAWKDRIANAVDLTGNGSVYDATGHGTHVTGIVGRVAPKATFHVCRVLNQWGVGSIQGIYSGIDSLIKQKVHVINGSLGSEVPAPMLAEICRAAWNAGIITVFASGNSGDRVISHPAADDFTISVAAHGQDLVIANFSSPSQVNLAAGGIRIVSLHLNGGMADLSGTSMAAPMVSGMFALGIDYCIRNSIEWTPDMLVEAAEESCEDIHDPGRDNRAGAGAIRFDKFIHALSQYLPIPDPVPCPVIPNEWLQESEPFHVVDASGVPDKQREYAVFSRKAKGIPV